MRTFFRTLVNFSLLVTAIGTEMWLSQQPFYLHSSRHGRIAILAGVAVAFFIAACIALAALKKAKKPASGGNAFSFPSAKRR